MYSQTRIRSVLMTYREQTAIKKLHDIGLSKTYIADLMDFSRKTVASAIKRVNEPTNKEKER